MRNLPTSRAHYPASAMLSMLFPVALGTSFRKIDVLPP